MKEELFDKRIRELLGSCSETPDPEVWDRIEAGLDIRRRRMRWRRIMYFSAAAAVVVGLFAVSLMQHVGTGQAGPEIQVAESQETSLPSGGGDLPRTLPLKALPGISVPVVAEFSGPDLAAGSVPPPVAVRDVRGRDTSDTAPLNGIQKKNGDRSIQSGIPSIYDQAARAEYIAMAGDVPAGAGAEKPSWSLSAGGNLSTARASGNVDFPQPSYSWGAGGSQSSSGIVPVSEPEHYFPVSVGLELKYSFLKNRLGVGLGVNYTFLKSRYEALVDRQYQASVDQSVHYVGIPLNFYVGILSGERLSFYAGAGCMMERAVKVSYSMTDLYSVKYQQEKKVPGVQWSVNVGLGFEYRFLDFMGVYVDPRLTYFFDCGQPYSVRTEQPLQFNLEMGFRFHIGA